MIRFNITFFLVRQTKMNRLEYKKNWSSQQIHCDVCDLNISKSSIYKHVKSAQHKMNAGEKDLDREAKVFLPNFIIENLKGKMKDNSIKTVENVIKNIYKTLGYDKYCPYVLEDKADDIIEECTKKPKQQTHKMYCVFNISNIDPKVDDTTKEKYKNQYDKAWKKANNKNKYQKATKKEEEEMKMITMSKVKQYAKDWKRWYQKDKTRKNHLCYLMSLFLAHLPIMRSQDYCNLEITNEPVEHNHYNASTGRIVLYEYKTAKKHGVRSFCLPKKIRNQIDHHIEHYSPTYVFEKQNFEGKSCESTNIRDLISKTLQISKISTRVLRKVYVSDMIDRNVSAHEREKIAKIMGHDSGIQQYWYSKFSKVLHPELDDEIKVIDVMTFRKVNGKYIRV